MKRIFDYFGWFMLGFGGGGSSSSSSANTTSTNTTNQNTDKRISQQSGVAVSGGNSPVTFNSSSVDAGTVQASASIANNAIGASTTNLSNLLSSANTLFSNMGGILANQSAANVSQSQSLTSAITAQGGGVNQKTILMLAVAGIAVYAMSRKRG